MDRCKIVVSSNFSIYFSQYDSGVFTNIVTAIGAAVGGGIASAIVAGSEGTLVWLAPLIAGTISGIVVNIIMAYVVTDRSGRIRVNVPLYFSCKIGII